MNRLPVTSLLVVLLGAPLGAQNAAPAGPSCDYDRCALRLEDRRILGGAGGSEVGHLGAWSATRLAPLVQTSDSARYYATQFDRNYASGARWTLLSGLALGVSLVYLTDRSRNSTDHWNGNDWAWLGTLVFSIGTGVYGEHRLNTAQQGLSRAMWWYNRDLAR